MNWEETLYAINALRECSLTMSEPGKWFARAPRIERKRPWASTCEGVCGRAATPEKAVAAYWTKITGEGWIILKDGLEAERRTVRWNGFMWVDTPDG
jgi:hypothetical protein